MAGHGQRLDQSRLIQRNVPDGVHPPLVHHDLFAQASPAAGEPDEAPSPAQVVAARLAHVAVAVHEVRFDDDVVTGFQPVHTFADFRDSPGEFVPQGWQQLIDVLNDVLFGLRDSEGEDRFPRSAGEYLDDWAGDERKWL